MFSVSNIKDRNKIDAIGFDVKTKTCILKIFDHLDWDDEYSHLLALQEKINTYFAFIESGEIHSAYKESKGKNIIISIDFLYPPSENCKKLIKRAKQIAKESLGIAIRFKTDP